MVPPIIEIIERDVPLVVVGTWQVTWLEVTYVVVASTPETAHRDVEVKPVPTIVMALASFVGASTGVNEATVAPNR